MERETQVINYRLIKRKAVSRRCFSKALLGCAMGVAWSALSGCSNTSITDFDDASAQVSPSSSSASSSQKESASSVSEVAATKTFFAFDTVITLSAYCDESILDEAANRCLFFENHFSRTVEGSDIWNVNNAQGSTVVVEPETADIVSRALEYARATEGLFDISIGAVSSLWDFVEAVKPSDEAIQEALKHINWKGITVNTETCEITLSDPQAKLDLGGIAKGYIADDICSLLVSRGCESAVVNLGGNVAVVGTKPDGSLWNVGIQNPNGSTSDVIASVQCGDTSVVTSGLYERTFMLDGVSYYHILDPRTGYPVKTDLESVSIVSAASIDGDVFATTAFLMGKEQAQSWIQEQGDYPTLFVDDSQVLSQINGDAFTLAGEDTNAN
jgi:thiamine biosynthesis lipoprotein